MKRKDLMILVGGSVMVVGSMVFIYFMLFQPKPKTMTSTESAVTEQATITGVINDDTLSKIGALQNYVSTNLDDIGRVDPFGPLK